MQCVQNFLLEFKVTVTVGTRKNNLPVVTEPGREIPFDFSDELHNRHVTGGPYVFYRK